MMETRKPVQALIYPRRDFIRKSSLGILGISLAPRTYPLFVNTNNKVVVVRHKNVLNPEGHARPNIVVEMVNRGIMALSGAGNTGDAWSRFFDPSDVIGMKINAISFKGLANTPLASHYPVLTRAIVSSCAMAGIQEKQFVIWDRSDAELVNLGYTPSNDPGGLRILGTYRHHRKDDGIGFHPEQYPVGKKSTRLSRILTDICTAMINVPVIKPHTLAGITSSLKNHYGTIDNPSSFHFGACTDPGIPEINAIPEIRKKERLVICNALLAIYRGGIDWKLSNTWGYGGIILGTDPVSVDRICLEILNEKRLQEGMHKIDNRSRHIPLSEQLGIGVADLDRIALVQIDLA